MQDDRSEKKQKRVIECAKYYKAGWSMALIAARVGINVKTVRRYLDEAGLNRITPRTIKAMQGAIYPHEIEEYKAAHGVGTKVRVFRTEGNLNKEYFAEIVAVYTHYARTDHGCFRWGDLVRYSRNQLEQDAE